MRRGELRVATDVMRVERHSTRHCSFSSSHGHACLSLHAWMAEEQRERTREGEEWQGGEMEGE